MNEESITGTITINFYGRGIPEINIMGEVTPRNKNMVGRFIHKAYALYRREISAKNREDRKRELAEREEAEKEVESKIIVSEQIEPTPEIPIPVTLNVPTGFEEKPTLEANNKESEIEYDEEIDRAGITGITEESRESGTSSEDIKSE